MPDSGWYPDPNSPETERYWDGNAWTTSTRPLQATPPAPDYQPTYEQPNYGQPAAQQPTYEQPNYGQPAAQQPSYEQPGYQQPGYQQPEYGQPAYGQPVAQQPAYGQPAIQPAYGQPGMAQSGWPGSAAPSHQPAGQYLPYGAQAPAGGVGATWGRRFQAYLIDWAIGAALMVVGLILSTIIGLAGGDVGAGIGGLLWIATVLAVVGFAIWNQFIRQGKTGQTIGKSKIGLKLVNDETGAPPGILYAFLRYLVAGLCAVLTIIDILSPLWDPRNQRLVDKWLKLMVYDVPKS